MNYEYEKVLVSLKTKLDSLERLKIIGSLRKDDVKLDVGTTINTRGRKTISSQVFLNFCAS